MSRLIRYEDYDAEIHGDGIVGAAVLGELIRITDYRCIGDGHLLMFAQAIGRFTVLNAHQESPHSVDDAQLLPENEESCCKTQ